MVAVAGWTWTPGALDDMVSVLRAPVDEREIAKRCRERLGDYVSDPAQAAFLAKVLSDDDVTEFVLLAEGDAI